MKHSTIMVTLRYDRGDNPPHAVAPPRLLVKVNNTQTGWRTDHQIRDQEEIQHVLRIDEQGIIALEITT